MAHNKISVPDALRKLDEAVAELENLTQSTVHAVLSQELKKHADRSPKHTLLFKAGMGGFSLFVNNKLVDDYYVGRLGCHIACRYARHFEQFLLLAQTIEDEYFERTGMYLEDIQFNGSE